MKFKYSKNLLIGFIFLILLVPTVSAANTDYKLSTVYFDNFQMDLPYGSFFNESDSNASVENFKIYENSEQYVEDLKAIVYCVGDGKDNNSLSNTSNFTLISKESNSALYEAPEELEAKYMLFVYSDNFEKDNKFLILIGDNLNLIREVSKTISFKN